MHPQEELRTTGSVSWELVTIALQPSKEQRELYPDLRTLASAVDKLDKSNLRRFCVCSLAHVRAYTPVGTEAVPCVCMCI